MAHYSVAATKDQLSRLIDKALAGEEVVITRHGKPTIAFHVLAADEPAKPRRELAFDRLRSLRESLPPAPNPIPLHRFSAWLYEDDEQ